MHEGFLNNLILAMAASTVAAAMVMPSPAEPAPPSAADSLVEAAIKVLCQPDPWKKADYTFAAVALWRSGAITHVQPADRRHSELRAPDRPARADDKASLSEAAPNMNGCSASLQACQT